MYNSTLTWYLDMTETSLSAKCGNEGLRFLQRVLAAHDLAYWDSFPLQVALMKYFFCQLGFNPCKAEQPLQGVELQEKETQKD